VIGDHGRVSRYFQAGDRVLWNPSNGVADLFVGTVDMLATLEGVSAGIGPMQADEYQLDVDAFSGFVDALVGRYLASRHPILRSLMEGFTATALVLVQRAGRALPALSAPPAPGEDDAWVGRDRMAAAEDIQRLRILGEEHATAMPY
jgi:hypothetical protein